MLPMSNETLNLGGAPINFNEGAAATAVTVTATQNGSPEGTIPIGVPDTTIPSQLSAPVPPEATTVAPKPEEEKPNFSNDVPADAEPAMEEVVDNDAELPPETDPLAAAGIYTDPPKVEEHPVIKASDPLETVVAAAGAARIGVVSATAIAADPIEERTAVPEAPVEEKIVDALKTPEAPKDPETPKAAPDPNEGIIRSIFELPPSLLNPAVDRAPFPSAPASERAWISGLTAVFSALIAPILMEFQRLSLAPTTGANVSPRLVMAFSRSAVALAARSEAVST